MKSKFPKFIIPLFEELKHEMVNYTPQDVKYFHTEEELENYYNHIFNT